MAPTPDTIAQAVERFVRGEFRIPPADRSFHRDVHLYDSGYVDSAGVVELIAFIESTFDITLQDDALFSDDFTTINGISNVVDQYLRRKSAIPSSTDHAAVARL